VQPVHPEGNILGKLHPLLEYDLFLGISWMNQLVDISFRHQLGNHNQLGVCSAFFNTDTHQKQHVGMQKFTILNILGELFRMHKRLAYGLPHHSYFVSEVI